MENNKNSKLSKDVLNSFASLSYSLNELQYIYIYNKLSHIVPDPEISFESMNLENILACEIVCSAICHKINWDFLRKTIFEKTLKDPHWLEPQKLIAIKSRDIKKLLSNYEKKERIAEKDCCKMLVKIGNSVLAGPQNFTNIFFDNNGFIRPYEEILDFFMSIDVFSSDPQHKKYQLLLQSLSDYCQFNFLLDYHKPTIDYHLIRLFLRRGIVKPNTSEAKEFVFNSNVCRQEKTMASLRQVCAESLETISWLTSLDIKTVNRIEWWIGRSVCTNGIPDCYLLCNETKWLKPHFDKCPYFEFCYARQIDGKYLEISEPTYKGNSY